MNPGMTVVAAEAYGVSFGIRFMGLDACNLPAFLPPCARPIDPADADHWYQVMEDSNGFIVEAPDASPEWFPDVRSSALRLENLLATLIALESPGLAALHAGVVEWRGRAIVLPAHSMSGKSTLVHAFVCAGARYLSDELALLDRHGMVHPYPRPLMLRTLVGDRYVRQRIDLPARALRREPLPVGLVVLTRFEPGSAWHGRPVPRSQAVLALIEHTVAMRHAPERTLDTLTALAEHTPVLTGPRGEASETVRFILQRVDEGETSGSSRWEDGID